jgi:hypothetical protein
VLHFIYGVSHLKPQDAYVHVERHVYNASYIYIYIYIIYMIRSIYCMSHLKPQDDLVLEQAVARLPPLSLSLARAPPPPISLFLSLSLGRKRVGSPGGSLALPPALPPSLSFSLYLSSSWREDGETLPPFLPPSHAFPAPDTLYMDKEREGGRERPEVKQEGKGSQGERRQT